MDRCRQSEDDRNDGQITYQIIIVVGMGCFFVSLWDELFSMVFSPMVNERIFMRN
jgi:hypothetical protein